MPPATSSPTVCSYSQSSYLVWSPTDGRRLKATQPEVETASAPVRLGRDSFHSRIEEYRQDDGTGFASCASGGGESKLDCCRQMVTRVTDPNDACLCVAEDHSPPYTASPQRVREGVVGQLAWSSINQPGPGECSEKLVA